MTEIYKYTNMTIEEKQFSRFMFLYGLLCAAAGLLSFFFMLDVVMGGVFNKTSAHQDTQYSMIWFVFVGPLMFAFSIMSLMSAFNVRFYRNCVIPILAGKGILFIFTVILLASSLLHKMFILVLLIDVPIFLCMFFFYIRVVPITVYILNTYLGTGITPLPKMASSARHVFFTDREFEILMAVTDTMIPSGGNPTHSAVELKTPQFVDGFVSQLGDTYKVLIPTLLSIVEYGAMLGYPFKTFSKLNSARREQYIKQMENSSFRLIRLAFLTIKMIIAQCYFYDERAFGDIKYGGPWVKE